MKEIKRVLLITLIACAMLFSISSCFSESKIKYYSEKSNYVSVTGVVSDIKYSDDASALYVGFSELSLALDDSSFKIVGENLKILENNEFDKYVKIGTRVDFITAPRYFGDGYVMPIVSVTVEETCLLNFEEGYTNLLGWLAAQS